MEAAPGVRFFVDRGIGAHVVPDAMRELGWDVVTMNERYGAVPGQYIPDEQWIEEAADRGEVLLSKDAAIARRPLEARAIVAAQARVFVISAASISGAAMAARVVRHRRSIERIVDGLQGPFVFALQEDAMRRLALRA